MINEITTLNPLPSQERIDELVIFIDKLTGPYTVLINPVAPMVRHSGVSIDEETQKSLQHDINKQGLCVAIPEKESVYTKGDRVIVRNHFDPVYTRVITTEEFLDNLAPNVVERIKSPDTKYTKEIRSAHYKKYLVLVVYTTDIIMSIKN